MVPTENRGTLEAEDDPRDVLDGLLAEWPVYFSADTFQQPKARRGKRFVNMDVARISAVIGLAKHVYDTVGAAIVLMDANHVNAAVPLARFAYESALTAVWLVQSKDQHGITAFVHEYARGRRALQQDAARAASSVFREGANDVTDADPSRYEGGPDSVQRFRQICLDLSPGGHDAYVLYRILSGYSHASVAVVDLHFQGGEQGVPSKLQDAKEAFRPAVLLYLMACSAVWAGRAFTYLSRDGRHRSAVRAAARQLGINSEPQLSESYWRRHARGGMRRRTQAG